MTFLEALREIESHKFAAHLNVASDFRTFLRAAEREESVRTLFRELTYSDRRERLFTRVLQLTNEQVDLRYQNPRDTALAVYVWLTSLQDWNLARVISQAVAQAPQCWWARYATNRILRGERMRSDSGFEVHAAFSLPSVIGILSGSPDSTEVILPFSHPRDLANVTTLGLIHAHSTESPGGASVQNSWSEQPHHAYSYENQSNTEQTLVLG